MKIFKILRLSGKRVILLAGLILLIFLGFNLFGQKKPDSLQFASVKKQDIKSIVSSSGSLTGKNAVDLKFKSSGKLAYLNIKAGDTVSKYQSIAGLDTTLLSIDLQQAQNTLRDKQATAEKVEDDVKDNEDDESYSQRQTRTTAQVARDNAYDDVKAARKALSEAHIYSPIAGIVTQAKYVAGQNVGASDVIAQIVDFSRIFFEAEIDEADISKISLNQKAEVSLDAYPDRIFEGEVWEIISQTKTTSQGATVVTVRINLGEETTQIQGLSGQATIILDEAKSALTIPLEALRDDNTVFVQNNQNFEPKIVVVGIKSDTDAEIKEGLEEREKVLLNPPEGGSFRSATQNHFGEGFRLIIGGGHR